MKGKYYAKHTLNHIVEKRYKKRYDERKGNEAYEAYHITRAKEEAIDFFKTNPNMPLNIKVGYLKKLRLPSSAVKEIIKTFNNDDELHVAYFGETIKESERIDLILGIIAFAIIFVIIGTFIFIFFNIFTYS